jgi:hypothetical protein
MGLLGSGAACNAGESEEKADAGRVDGTDAAAQETRETSINAENMNPGLPGCSRMIR